ncbi:hypothetical protein ABXN37_26530 [Piscinibacter sakaiensis]|uniref:Uncharacterized protein n=1 Tax=Piscinibacter sakaiensis TaxID=1547922 RepID=A0A0K8P7S0_PISS1|nr:hypothetical protein [Piscinibacter sakaiensis]GAP38662.1 hypothetical protein ISF6_5215 [Piscinibacter sakaiensis]
MSKLIKAPAPGTAGLEGLEPTLIDADAHARFVRNVFALRARTASRSARRSMASGEPKKARA